MTERISSLRLLLETADGITAYPFTDGAATVGKARFWLETERAEEGVFARLFAESQEPLGLQSMAVEFLYRGETAFSTARIFRTGGAAWDTGVARIGEGTFDDLHLGVVTSEKEPCVFISNLPPQSNWQGYKADLADAHTLKITAKVRFTRGQAKQKKLQSERVFFCDDKPLLPSIQAWAAYLPALPEEKRAPISYGWNSWDYYFETVSHEDIEENVEAIKADPVLREKLRYIIVDDGWSHNWGDWEPNYRFPKGMKYTADYIKEQGFIPGIWTAPVKLDFECYLVRRRPELLVKDDYGDPYRAGRRCYIDPTSPAGEAFIYDLYKKLYDWGYRIFKTDFVSALLDCPGFYQEKMGPYDALRFMYATIRSAVGEDAHILGCNLGPQVGPGVVDSNRAGNDIHNDWGCMKAAVAFLQMRFWWHDHIATPDGDFILARGPETSTEAKTNIITDFKEHYHTAQGHKKTFFTAAEAQTWANIDAFFGGNRMLSDHIGKLNETGLAILREALQQPEEKAFLPLDLGRKDLAEYWYKETEDTRLLLMVNFEDTPQEMGVGIDLPFAVAPITLPPHASILMKRRK